MNESEGIQPPDWDRFGIKPPNEGMAVGDATRWGAQDVTLLPNLNCNIDSPQIVQVGTRDRYARAWTILGTLAVSTTVWNTAGFLIWLDVVMGVGQAQLNHRIVLLSPDPATGLPAFGGLCLTQYWKNGGPYYANPEGLAVASQARAFAVVGGLVGQSMSVRMHFQATDATPIGATANAITTLIVTPYAAGEGL